MPIGSCSSGLLATALVAFLLVPAQYFVPNWPRDLTPTKPAKIDVGTPNPKLPVKELSGWIDLSLPSLDVVYYPTLDLVFTFSLFFLGVCTYLCEWIQRKLLERRMLKLNQYLGSSVERLREWDAQQEQLESTLRMVQNATSEYNLLLYLLLRQHHCLPDGLPGTRSHAPEHCFFEKETDEELSYLRPTEA